MMADGRYSIRPGPASPARPRSWQELAYPAERRVGIDGGVIRLGNVDALRQVDAPVAGPEVGRAAGDGEVDGQLRSEKFDAHDRAGQGRVGRPGEDGDEAQGGGEVGGEA